MKRWVRVIAALLAVSSAHAPMARAACPPSLITTPTVIAAADTCYDNKDVIVSGTTVTIVGPHTFQSLTVQLGGTVTHVAEDTTGVTLVVSANCTVDATSAITAAGRGYAGGTGPGSPGSAASYYCGGAAYGGEGGDGSGQPGSRAVYGSVTQPTSLGSGGGWYSSQSYAGFGGGAVRLVVTGTLHVDGSVSADGGDGTSYGGGGSGGSLWLSVGTLEGGGVISASGGAPGYTGGGGGGSGGRIAVNYSSNTFSGSIRALGNGSGGSRRAGAGTVLTQQGSSRPTITIANTGADLASRRTIFYGQPVSLDANMVVRDGGVVAPADQDSLWLSLTGNLTIESGGMVGSDQRGFLGGTGPGSAGSSASYYCGGAAYGGDGGDGSAQPGSSAVYGSVAQPTSPGSGGGWYSSQSYGGIGGGAIRLSVAGTLHVDGSLNANGGDGTSYGGGGSGGSLWLNVATLEGSGLISANGGAAGYAGGGGGGSGGRIAVYYTTNAFSGPIQALGGVGLQRGGAGTLLTQASGGRAQITVANLGAGPSAARTTLRPTAVTTNADLTARDGGQLAPIGSHTFYSLSVISTGTVTTAIGDTTGVTLVVSANCTVDATSAITAAGRGYAGGTGPGSPGSAASYYCGGAAYGGEGGDGSGQPGSRAVYGSVTQPTSLGSGGGWYSSQSYAGFGGGAVRLVVTGTLHVDGSVSADGGDGTSYGGGGSGGSLWLSVGTLEGGGVISASGGAPGYTGGGGGGSGGRIAVNYSSNTFSGSIRALGNGSGGSRRAGAGTVLTQQGSSRPTITIANTGADSTNRRTIFASDVTSFDANMVVRDGGVVAPADQDSLWLSLSGNLTIESGGMVGSDQRGFLGGTGPGSAGSSASYYCGGAAYGGEGGDGSAQPGSSAVYGSVAQPTSPGSGGGWYSSQSYGGTGGGAIRLSVAGTLHVDGRLNADGGPGTSYGGGGSGGSLWLHVATLEGSGLISASGGPPGYTGGGGGGSGGRIAAYFSTNTFSGSIRALGNGSGGSRRAGAGTLLTQQGSSRPTITIANTGGDAASRRTIFASGGSSFDANMDVRDGGAVAPADMDSLWLNITGNLTIGFGATVGADQRGFLGGTGPGSAGSSASYYCGGAAYGGVGGDGSAQPGSHAVYGSETHPSSLGSGGGWYSSQSYGGTGGGAIRLTVAGTLHVDGNLNADGGPGTSYGGGGSGGSLWLDVGTLEGSGTISVSGGDAGYTGGGGGGGGGRLAIFTYCWPNYSFPHLLLAGGAGLHSGAPATFYPNVGVTGLAAGAIGLTGAVRKLRHADSFDLGALESNDSLWVYSERTGALPPPQSLVTLDISQPGVVTNVSQFTPATLDTGTYVNSQLLHFDPVGNGSGVLRGSVTFDTNVLGIIVTSARLNATDHELHRPDALYATTYLGRGAEFDGSAEQDTVTLSADRRTVTFASHVASGLDEIRIVTAVPPGSCGAADVPPLTPIAETLPRELFFAPASPNPARGATAMSFALPHAGLVSLDIFDVAGRRVTNLQNGLLPAGRYKRLWDGTGMDGVRRESGVYFARLTTKDGARTQRVELVR